MVSFLLKEHGNICIELIPSSQWSHVTEEPSFHRSGSWVHCKNGEEKLKTLKAKSLQWVASLGEKQSVLWEFNLCNISFLCLWEQEKETASL